MYNWLLFSRTGQILDVSGERTPESIVYSSLQKAMKRFPRTSVIDYTTVESFWIEKITGSNKLKYFFMHWPVINEVLCLYRFQFHCLGYLTSWLQFFNFLLFTEVRHSDNFYQFYVEFDTRTDNAKEIETYVRKKLLSNDLEYCIHIKSSKYLPV